MNYVSKYCNFAIFVHVHKEPEAGGQLQELEVLRSGMGGWVAGGEAGAVVGARGAVRGQPELEEVAAAAAAAAAAP